MNYAMPHPEAILPSVVPPLHKATARVPGSSANLGPGFDCLGLALDLYLRVECQVTGGKLAIEVPDAQRAEIALNAENLVYRAMRLVFEAVHASVPGLHLSIDSGIPLSRGLGSSAAAIAAGLVLANALAGDPLDRHALLNLGIGLEGHPDNLAPALFGGLQVSSLVDGRALTLPAEIKHPPRIVLFVPDFVMSTAEARRVLPERVSRADAVFNTGRAALLIAALAAGDLAALRWAMEDRLHQPYRGAIFPALPRLIEAALHGGAAGAALSGAGSTVLAFCERPEPVAAAMASAAESLGLPGRSIEARIDFDGARVVPS